MAKKAESGAGEAINKSDLPKAKLTVKNLKKSLRRFSYLGRNKWKFTVGMIFLALSAGVGLMVPMQSGEMLGYIGENSKSVSEIESDLYSVGLFLLVILLAQAVFSFGRVYFFAQV